MQNRETKDNLTKWPLSQEGWSQEFKQSGEVRKAYQRECKRGLTVDK